MAAPAAKMDTMAATTMSSVSVKACICLQSLGEGILGRLPVRFADGQNISSILRLVLAFLTVQHLSKMLVAARFRQHPRPARHRRLVTHMLSMAAGQIGNPIAIIILVIPNDRLLHAVMIHLL